RGTGISFPAHADKDAGRHFQCRCNHDHASGRGRRLVTYKTRKRPRGRSWPCPCRRAAGAREQCWNGARPRNRPAATSLRHITFGILPNVMCRNDVAAGRLVRLLEEWECPRLQAYASYLGRRRVPRKTRVFMEFLSSYLLTDDPDNA